ncbi:MAG TPA: gamma-glutamyltransferase [Steroidobacteraceae bacterium]|nr:gamma-glutamyltransferase [Steroidobacteraceae bacterium]
MPGPYEESARYRNFMGASDLFAVIYIARDHKVYALNASGTAPTGATLERLNELGYHWNPKNWVSAGLLMRDGQPVMTVTLMGGDMQAQGHAQLLVDVIDLGANVQAAADMARFRHSQVPNVLSLESPLYDLVGSALAALGHSVRSINGEDVGGVQIIQVAPGDSSRRYYRGGSDFRKDGQAAGW